MPDEPSISDRYYNGLVRVAGDGKHSANVVENLCGYVRKGPLFERAVALEMIGKLRIEEALSTLIEVLEDCRRSLLSPEPDGHALQSGADVCRALAMFDCEDTHRVLVHTSRFGGDLHLRGAAITALGIERDWHDEALIRYYLDLRKPLTLRIAAVDAIFESTLAQRRKYKDLLLELLRDKSPGVVIFAVDALVGLVPQHVLSKLLSPLVNDRRRCRRLRTTVSQSVAGYGIER